ncbi:MAG: phosphoribosyl 1,2-cyclic phosphodiesterase [Alphaproteobacteria bacterium]|nr:MAG: phosphoribosyl 1,2-cyclic phosphodiesterase [Alphaproteobacteria bacterium]
MSYRFTILGCGSSPGVPRIDGEWGACDPNNPKNRRRRCSLLVERLGPQGTTTVLVDTSPDLREQMLMAGVRHIDGVLYTHGHADHIHGIDDLRQYALLQRRLIDTYADSATLAMLTERFSYCYETPPGSIYPPILKGHPIAPGKIVRIDGQGGPVEALPVRQVHGPAHSLGFRFGGDLAARRGGLCYSPDISDVPADSIALLERLDIWVVDALQYRVHLSHFALSQALEWIERLRPVRAVLTHMHTALDYETLRLEIPANIEPAYDGMVIEWPASGAQRQNGPGG